MISSGEGDLSNLAGEACVDDRFPALKSVLTVLSKVIILSAAR